MSVSSAPFGTFFEAPQSLESPLTRSFLSDSIRKYPPRENLLRAKTTGKVSSPTKTPRFGGGDHNSVTSSIQESSLSPSKSSHSPLKSNVRSSPSREVDGFNVSPTRGSLLGPFNFMTANIEQLHSNELTKSEMITIHRQLVLLRLQMKYKNNQDRVISKDQVLQAWYYVTEQEEKTFLMQRKLEEFECIMTGQKKLEDMERQVEKTYESLAPTFEKLAKFNELKTAQKNRREFLKSTKSFRAKATINQEYSQKILDLEKSVRLIERMNEKKVRLNKAPVSASVHRINSLEVKRRDQSPAPLSQNSSFIVENKDGEKEQPKELLSPVNKPSNETKSSSAVSSLLENPPVSELETISLRKVEQTVDNTPSLEAESNEKVSEMKTALNNLRSSRDQEKAEAVVAKEIEFKKVQLNPILPSSSDNQQMDKEQDDSRNLLTSAKNSLRPKEQTEIENNSADEQQEVMNEEQKSNPLLQVQLRKVEVRDAADGEGSLKEDMDVAALLAMKRDTLRVVPNKRGSMVSTAEMPPLTSEELSPRATEGVVDSGASVSSLADDQSTIAASEQQPSQSFDAQSDVSVSQTTHKARVWPPNPMRSNSDHSKDSGPAFQNTAVFGGKASSVRGSNHEDDVDSVSSKVSSRSNISSSKQVKDTSSVTHNSAANDVIASPPRVTLDIEHLKDTLRPVVARDNSNRQKPIDEHDQTSAVPIMHAKEHLNHVVHNQDKTRDDDNQWAAPILQAKETLRPITAREKEKELQLKNPALTTSAVTDGSPTVNEQAAGAATGDTPSSPSDAAAAGTAVKATEFERKASVFGKLVRKVSGIMDRTAAAAMSPAYAERVQQQQQQQQQQDTPSQRHTEHAEAGGAALFEQAAALDEDHSTSRQKVTRNPSYDPTNRHHDHDEDDDVFGDDEDNAIVHNDEFLGDLGLSVAAAPAAAAAAVRPSATPKTTTPSATTSSSSTVTSPNTDVQVISLTKANLERTASLRAESTDSTGPVSAFRGSFTTGHNKPSFAEDYQQQQQLQHPSAAAARTSSSPLTPDAVSPAAALAGANVTTGPSVTDASVAVPRTSSDLQLDTASQGTGSETESQLKKKKSGMNFMKGLRKRTSSIFGASKSGHNLDVNVTAASADSFESSPVPGQPTPQTPKTAAMAVDNASVSDVGVDDSASQQSDKRKKSGGFSGFMRSSSSMFRRSKSGNYAGANGAGNEGIIPEDEEVDFSESVTPVTGSQKAPIGTDVSPDNEPPATQNDDLDETGSQMTANSEKKKRLSMKGLMKRTSSLFK